MKLFGAMIVAFLAVGSLSAQYRSAGGFGNVVFPGLGFTPTANPWGNVVTPAIPQGAAALASGNRYGSLIGGFGGYGVSGRGYGGSGRGSGRSRSSGIYAYPVYVGGYGYGNGYGNGYPPDQGAPPAQDSGAGNGQGPAPVIINQYFGTPPPNPDAPPDAGSSSTFHYYQSPVSADNAPAADPSYYLIAFKDHSVYSAIAYYTDGDTLHYFTPGNVHNQVSLSLVDRQLTEQLNHQHNVDVHLP
jgi:hypothetical protein